MFHQDLYLKDHEIWEICLFFLYQINIFPSQGLFAQNKEKLINMALCSLIEREGDQDKVSNECLEAQFHALRRLVASKAGYQGFTEIPR